MSNDLETYGSETEGVIPGRPDFCNFNYLTTNAKKFPPYVFSIRGGSALVHKVQCVRLRWWEPQRETRGQNLVKLRDPIVTAHTVCGMFYRLRSDRSRTCRVPSPDALLCGRCHGEPATFGKHGKGTREGIPRRVAHVKLGCVVAGY